MITKMITTKQEKEKGILALKEEYQKRINNKYLFDETYSVEENAAFQLGRRVELRQVIRDLEELLK